MSEERFLEGYDGQSIEELIELADEYDVESVVLACEAAIEAKREAGEEISDAERVVLAITAMEREVNNGGFSQFFTNTSNEYAADLVDALQEIGCRATAGLAEEAVDRLGLDTLDADAIEARMDPDDDELESALGELDERYYEAAEHVSARLFDYMRDNRDDINIG